MRSAGGAWSWIALAAALCGCGGSPAQQQEQREAAGIAGIAAALQVVQTARAQAPDAPAAASPAGCCNVCGECDFPCGDLCVPYGTACLDPPGCACSDAAAEGRDRPREPGPPAGCPAALPSVAVTPD